MYSSSCSAIYRFKIFNYSNKVDVHKQVIQYDLALKKKGLIHDGELCLYTTIIGMTLIDCWEIARTRCNQTKEIHNFIGSNMLINWVRK